MADKSNGTDNNKGSDIRKRIDNLRKRMTARRFAKIDVCIITDNDDHNSEYSSDYYALRTYFSGFTGSNGTLLVMRNKALLFTDGRYFLQAEKQLENTGIELMRQGTPGVMTPVEYIKALAVSGKINVGAVGETLSAETMLKLEECGNITITDDFDPIENEWKDRPGLPLKRVYQLEDVYTGETAESKINRIREKIKEAGAGLHIVSSLDDIAWILNLRGSDIECNPVFRSFLLISQKDVVLFADPKIIDDAAMFYLKQKRIKLMAYDDIYTEAEKAAGKGEKVLLDKGRTNCRLAKTFSKEQIIWKDNPSVLMKSIKNETEINNLKSIHVEDGLCVTGLMIMVKSALRDGKILTELKVSDYIDELRSRIKDYKDFSFPTISAYGPNAAMMHYLPDEDSNARIMPGNVLLVDSGGQYLRGTTDVTRTLAIGEVSEEIKKAFTLTLKGMLALASAVFLRGCSGYSLDILARGPLWKNGIDYRCGTGHGVGYMLNVHEGPNAFRWRYFPNVSEYAVLEPGMVTTDEPGVYIDGQFGIRIENELLCESAFTNEYGEFLRFRHLTMAPIDLDMVDKKYLDENDIRLLNEYHAQVYEALSPHLSGEELEYLKEYTKEI